MRKPSTAACCVYACIFKQMIHFFFFLFFFFLHLTFLAYLDVCPRLYRVKGGWGFRPAATFRDPKHPSFQWQISSLPRGASGSKPPSCVKAAAETALIRESGWPVSWWKAMFYSPSLSHMHAHTHIHTVSVFLCAALSQQPNICRSCSLMSPTLSSVPPLPFFSAVFCV